MRSSVLIGFVGGIIVALLQFYSMKLSMEDGATGTFEMLLYYSPQIIYFMCIYMSVKIFTRMQPNTVPEFKGCLKAGGLTAVIITIIWGIGFFVALTHIDVPHDVKRMIESGHKDEVNLFLSSVTKQTMMDRAQFWSIPNFLLGFVMTVLVTVVFRLRGKKAS
ncbi:MAG: hypothetical protein ABIQ40_10245 [Bacteroidia bacterium]